jgi:hypothetical protein
MRLKKVERERKTGFFCGPAKQIQHTPLGRKAFDASNIGTESRLSNGRGVKILNVRGRGCGYPARIASLGLGKESLRIKKRSHRKALLETPGEV